MRACIKFEVDTYKAHKSKSGKVSMRLSVLKNKKIKSNMPQWFVSQ